MSTPWDWHIDNILTNQLGAVAFRDQCIHSSPPVVPRSFTDLCRGFCTIFHLYFKPRIRSAQCRQERSGDQSPTDVWMEGGGSPSKSKQEVEEPYSSTIPVGYPR